jgi:hypothetical protein
LRYDPTGNNFDQVTARSKPLKQLLNRKAQAGATFWTMNSIIRTGFNASSVKVLDGMNATNDKQVSVIYAHGYYAKWRERGGKYNRPERVMWRSVPAIKAS